MYDKGDIFVRRYDLIPSYFMILGYKNCCNSLVDYADIFQYDIYYLLYSFEEYKDFLFHYVFRFIGAELKTNYTELQKKVEKEFRQGLVYTICEYTMKDFIGGYTTNYFGHIDIDEVYNIKLSMSHNYDCLNLLTEKEAKDQLDCYLDMYNRKKKDAYTNRKKALKDFLDRNQCFTDWYVVKENDKYSVVCYCSNGYKAARQGMTLKELVTFVTYVRLGFILVGQMLKEKFTITENMILYSLSF